MAANDVPCCEPMFWIYLCISAALVCFAGLMSGLTLGLMSLSLMDLEVLSKAGQPEDRKNAEKILPVVKNQHLLLCTLLIYNSMAMEALPIFLDSILPAWCSILISVTLILAFGEIIPQAVCTRYGLSVGAKLSILVRLLMVVLFPIAYPISKVLDLILGKNHSALLRRSELKTFVDLHGNEAGRGGELSHHETAIIGGALDLTQKAAKDAMTPMSQVFSLDINTKLDRDVVELIMRKGHSRIPIYSGSKTNIIGLILVKNLVGCRPENETPVRDLTIRKIPRFYDHQPLYDILTQFEKGHSHMGVVVKSNLDVLRVSGAAGHSVLYDLTEKLKLEPEQEERKGASNQPSMKEFARKTSIMHLNPTKARSPPLSGMMEHGQSTDWNTGNMNMSAADLDFVSSSNEEVIGIITMEDVMEELLQDEIWDETDEYVDVHNKIQISMKPDKKPSPRRSPAARLGWSHHVASPLSPYHNTPPSRHRSPLLRSPASPYAISPQMRPTVLSSPRRSMLS